MGQVSKETFEAIMSYLAKRPYAEVAPLFAAVSSDLSRPSEDGAKRPESKIKLQKVGEK